MEKDLTDLVLKLHTIAKKNDDDFRYRLEIDPTRKPRFIFVVKETADGHAFLVAPGQTISDVIALANDQIPGACKEWGYKL